MARLTAILSALLVVLVPLSTAHATAQIPETHKYVIFRDDDVGLGSQIDTLKAINQVHVDENVPVTLGIVPHLTSIQPPQLVLNDVQPSWIAQQGYSDTSNQLYQDPAFRDYMRTISSNPLFEFAQHGYTHQSNGLSTSSHNTSEFSGEPYSVQYSAIRAGRDDMQEAFGKTPTTFIPPWDRGDVNTREAARALGFTDYCTGGTEMGTLYGHVDGMRVEPANVDIYGSSYAALNQSATFAKVRFNQFIADPHNDTFVVGYHFWSFGGPKGSVDLNKVQLLRDFVTYVNNHGRVSFTTLDRSVIVPNHASAATVEPGAASPSESVVRDGSLPALSGMMDDVVNVLPLHVLLAFVVGVVFIGLPLYVQRRRDSGARSLASSPAIVEKHTSAEDHVDVVQARLARWDHTMFRSYGLVIPADGPSAFVTPAEQQCATMDAEPSAGDATDRE